MDVNLHLRGIDFSAENIKSPVIGGVAFATPNKPGAPAAAGEIFPLNNKPEIKWFDWAPSIALTNASIVMSVTAETDPLDLGDVNQPQK